MSPFTIKIFVADGDPDGLRVVDRSNWSGKALIFPRPLFPKIKHRAEFSQTGVYILIGPRQDADGDMLYVGEGDPVRPRLEAHFAQKDFWTKAVFFVAGMGHLNKAHVQFLESQLIQRAKAAKIHPLDNSTNPTEPTLSEADRADLEVFLENMLGILPILGINSFETSPAKPISSLAPTLKCSGKGVAATGYETTQGFVVKNGSTAVIDTAPSMSEHIRTIFDIRVDLIKRGVLIEQGYKYVFSQDYTFSSPSTAAAVVLGRSANGRIEWKDDQGKTLKQLQELVE